MVVGKGAIGDNQGRIGLIEDTAHFALIACEGTAINGDRSVLVHIQRTAVSTGTRDGHVAIFIGSLGQAHLCHIICKGTIKELQDGSLLCGDSRASGHHNGTTIRCCIAVKEGALDVNDTGNLLLVVIVVIKDATVIVCGVILKGCIVYGDRPIGEDDATTTSKSCIALEEDATPNHQRAIEVGQDGTAVGFSGIVAHNDKMIICTSTLDTNVYLARAAAIGTKDTAFIGSIVILEDTALNVYAVACIDGATSLCRVAAEDTTIDVDVPTCIQSTAIGAEIDGCTILLQDTLMGNRVIGDHTAVHLKDAA